jgi:membrane protease YdiL (CAAX protease family)
MLVPLLVGNWGLPASLSHLFAVTSLAVGVREELAYRGVLQTLLTGKFGFWTALILSNIVFVVYHYGAQPLTIWNVFQLFSFGCVLGVVFYLTQSLVLVAVLHALYDAIYCYTPLLSNPLSLWVGAVLLSIPLLGVIAIKGRTSQALGRFVIDQDR